MGQNTFTDDMQILTQNILLVHNYRFKFFARS